MDGLAGIECWEYQDTYESKIFSRLPECLAEGFHEAARQLGKQSVLCQLIDVVEAGICLHVLTPLAIPQDVEEVLPAVWAHSFCKLLSSPASASRKPQSCPAPA